MRRSIWALCAVLILAGPAIAESSTPAAVEVPEKALCTVCVRRGSTHGEEEVAASRLREGTLYTFCSTACAEAFDQMPEGYATPVLPRPAPTVTLTATDGAAIALPMAGTRATIVDFWATWCGPCIAMMPELAELYEEHREDGLAVVGISIDQDAKALEKFLRQKAPPYPVAHDTGDDPAWWAFRVPVIPAVFLLDAHGQVVAQWGADLTAADLRNRVAQLMEAPSER